ncbi:hemin-degrading factor [Erwinia sp. OLTSP20]|uniref:hemin-degrading factor n=1 Tax=unclassified Erwinia TaxID=2622719 RepID=UPI000C19B447|nr:MULTISPECIES: ChuX/HutX family heme-like substrate-binding protein [unclassified Erwinia]PIJ50236.1 hemin-degrading factor [Erwinia sp. OAMSP11]PIJ72074.1 hemin-degrading factor [Erwinia sp. OLSSP12]PIJ81365.1 hemin-degrading factor [Erwinia sp. OLCASP19]PIJ84071.1 hemin-degrading factor [Erwinia sp. OLMTSP26]PIJ85770.1 hemin-degrading factor [Erwinia sp. OLMDSP33]
MSQLYQQYLALKTAEPKKYARELAAHMGISEARLAMARCGHDAQALKTDVRQLLGALSALGETKSITRNAYAVHEIIGRYDNLHLGNHAGLVLNPRALDLRLFPEQWHSAFALREASARGERHSIQFFDTHGDAVLKVYATDNTDMLAWQSLVGRFSHPGGPALNLTTPEPACFNPQPDVQRIEQEWRAMSDVHQFFSLLKRHNISRQQAFSAVADDLAYRVDNQALARLLRLAKEDGNEIMIFVGNRGCTQIFTGVVESLKSAQGWLNIFNPAFTLHLQETQIAESWVTRKPTDHDFVTSLELFAADGTQIAQLYGQRSEGQAEQARWRQQLATLNNAGEMA